MHDLRDQHVVIRFHPRDSAQEFLLLVCSEIPIHKIPIHSKLISKLVDKRPDMEGQEMVKGTDK